MFPWLDGLNPRQREAVTFDGPALLIIAGAGTGKTRTLASRVARLVGEGVAPERILLLTFSRRAAREMIRRAERLTGDHRTGRVAGGTFHSVANRLLRQHGTAVGLDPTFTILDAGDTGDLLSVLRHELGLGDGRRRFPRKEALAAIYSRMVNEQVPLADAVARWFPWCRNDVAELRTLFAALAVRKRDGGVLDYDDLLLYWRALVQSAECGPLLREQFDHVLVDEYQDTNAVQADIVVSLCRDAANVCVVGDDAQAIYGFRAGSPKHLLDFPERFPGAGVLFLRENYRSTTPILTVANAVMAAADGFEKELWSSRPGSERPTLTACADESVQADVVCRRVLEHRDRGVNLREQAVVFRTGHHSASVELELARRNIPFVKYGGLKFLEAAHVKDALALLRILDNPRDEVAWHRVLGLLDGVGPATVRKVLSALGDDPLVRLLEGAPLPAPPAADAAVASLRTVLAECRGAGEDPPPAVQLERIATFLRPIVERRYEAAAARLVDLDELCGLAATFPDRTRFLAELTLDPPVSTSDLAGPPHLDDDYLVLSTIHSAKGGEWKVVHLIHASDGNIPSDMALSDREGLEEERRLLYVALTRARESLHVTYPQRYYHRRQGHDDAHTYGQPSRFLVPAMSLFDRTVEAYGESGGIKSAAAVAPSGDPVAALLSDLLAERDAS